MTRDSVNRIRAAAQSGAVEHPDDRNYRKKGVSVPNDIRKMVYRRDGYQCAMCSEPGGLQIHHAVKRSQGGSDFPENLITLCWKCHAVAHGMKFDNMPEYIDESWMEQHIVEYLSDWVAENENRPWYPFK